MVTQNEELLSENERLREKKRPAEQSGIFSTAAEQEEEESKKAAQVEKIQLMIELKKQKIKRERDLQMRQAVKDTKHSEEEHLALLTAKIGSDSSEILPDCRRVKHELSFDENFGIVVVHKDTGGKLAEKKVDGTEALPF